MLGVILQICCTVIAVGHEAHNCTNTLVPWKGGGHHFPHRVKCRLEHVHVCYLAQAVAHGNTLAVYDAQLLARERADAHVGHMDQIELQVRRGGVVQR
jgi:hypothetical protein